MLQSGVRTQWLIMSKRRTDELQDSDSSAGEERRRVKAYAEWQKGAWSSLHGKGKFLWLYFADTINFLLPFQQRKQEIKNWIFNIVYHSVWKIVFQGGPGSEEFVIMPVFSKDIPFVVWREMQIIFWCNFFSCNEPATAGLSLWDWTTS